MTNLDAGERARSASASRRRLVPPLVWRRLPWYAELAIIAVCYAVYTRIRLAAPDKEQLAFFHSQQVWDLQQLLHLDVEPVLNQIVAAWAPLGNVVGYYYGTLHFVVTPAVLVWLWLRRPQAYPRLRSTIMIATLAALIVYWTWPLAPPRFALPGAVDVLAQRDIFGAADPSGISSMVNLYAAMPSLHVAWAVWCAAAIYLTTSGRWRRLVWLYPIATTLVVLGSANHYLLDAAGGVAIVVLGLFLTRPYGVRHGASPGALAGGAARVRDTDSADSEVLDQRIDGGSMSVARRPSAPTPPTDR